jgi:negative regulator of flagellin synthesis FlgM
MQIHGIGNLQGAQQIRPTQGIEQTTATQQTQLHEADQVDISPEADMISRVHELPEMRADRIAEIRAELAAGTYETEEKLDMAIGRLLDELVG